MLYLMEGIGLVILVLWLFCIFDVITTDETQCRNLPKLVWVLVVLFLPTIGSLLWLIAGRPQGLVVGRAQPPAPPNAHRYPEYDRPGRFAATNPDDDEEFLRRCRERAEEQRRNAPKPPED